MKGKKQGGLAEGKGKKEERGRSNGGKKIRRENEQ